MRFLGYAIIIGAMKSGTTSLHHILVQHPEIAGGRVKELDYFRKAISHSVTGYEANFPKLDKERHAYTLDSSPNYTKAAKWPDVASRIASFPGRKRLIYVLRNPIERIDSHIAHQIQRGRWTNGKWPIDHMVDISSYCRQLMQYEKAGLLDDVLLLDFASLRDDPVAAAYAVHDFLRIPRIEPQRTATRNGRKVGSFLKPEQLDPFREVLRRDVEMLISRYGFEPAKAWKIC